MKPLRLILNGRFLTRRPTGVDRFAREIGEVLASDVGGDGFSLVVPPNIREASLNQSAMVRIPVHKFGFANGHVWEQIFLPFFQPSSVLLSLCNIGPVLRRRQCLMVADAQFASQPMSYSRAFRWWYRLVLPIVARRAKFLITISEYSRAELEYYGVFPKGKAHIIPCGGDHILRVIEDSTILDRLKVSSGSYFLTIGSLAPHKNIGPLIRSVAGRMPGNTKLVVAGAGNSRVFKNLDLTVAADIVFAGPVTDGELKALLANATGLLFPSITEGFGLPPLEAMMVGCPVIASTGGAIPEVCGPAALYVDPFDMEGWLRAVCSLAEDFSKRDKMAKLGKERASLFRWANSAKKLQNLLSGTL